MRILFVAPYTPNLIRVRPYQIIRHLARRGHDVTVATLWTTPDEQEQLEQLKKQGLRVIGRRLPPMRSWWNCVRALPTTTPLQASFCWQPELAYALLTELTTAQEAEGSGFDVVHVEHLRGARYGLWLKSRLATWPSNGRMPIVWDSVDCISHLFSQAAGSSRSLKGRLMTRLELARTSNYEGWLQTQFDKVIVTSPVDKVAMESLNKHVFDDRRRSTGFGQQSKPHSTRRKIEVLPNGVDLDYFTPGTDIKEPATLVFSGKMSYHANVSAAVHLVDDIMPLIWKERPDVQICIVGKDPTNQVRQLGTRHASRVQVIGTVQDLRPFLRRATIAVCPTIYGAGIQNKILEAMACGTPVVASRQATYALEASPGTHLLAADDESAFARKVLTLLAEPAQQNQLAEAGRRYVEQLHSWTAVAEQLEMIYRGALPTLDPLGASATRMGNPNSSEMMVQL